MSIYLGIFQACVQDLNWEDVRSTSSYSEAEEKTIKAVFEQMKVQLLLL